jgi:hypothetical protein
MKVVPMVKRHIVENGLHTGIQWLVCSGRGGRLGFIRWDMDGFTKVRISGSIASRGRSFDAAGAAKATRIALFRAERRVIMGKPLSLT